MKPEFNLLDRREFVAFASKLAAVAGLAGLARESRGDDKNSFNYQALDSAKHWKTDPKLIGYAEVTRWRSQRIGARRLAVSPDGRIQVCADNYISSYSEQGDLGPEIALPGLGSCIATTEGGDLYVGLRDHIEVFDKKGTRRRSEEHTSELQSRQ